MMVGFKGILLAAVILMFASPSGRSDDTGCFVVRDERLGGVPAFIIPVGVFLVTSFVSFSDGSSWSTYGIMFPIAIPLAFSTGANLPLVLGAVFSGGIFGDHTSQSATRPSWSPSTSGSDHMVHLKIQALRTHDGGIAAVLLCSDWCSSSASSLLTDGVRPRPHASEPRAD